MAAALTTRVGRLQQPHQVVHQGEPRPTPRCHCCCKAVRHAGNTHKLQEAKAQPSQAAVLGIAAAMSAAAGASASHAAEAAATTAAAAAAVVPVDPSTYVTGPVEVGWQIWFAAIISTVPFVIGAYEFGKRILIQRRCKVCGGSGLVQKGKYPKKCPECGGFFPWISWRMFLSANARPGNGGPLLQPRGQTSVFYTVPSENSASEAMRQQQPASTNGRASQPAAQHTAEQQQEAAAGSKAGSSSEPGQ